MIYKFKPLLKQTLWGGDRIIPFKKLDTVLANVGESWEISGFKGNETIVSEGPDAGKQISQLIREQGAALVGRENYERYGDVFPLLIKFIDAQKDLSIQVHPDDATARRLGREKGKSEMWYILPSEPGAQLYCGLRQRLSPEEYRHMVASDSITEALAHYDAHEGDVFYIPAGRIHSIGAGCFVAEIQQTSDVTFRIYDFKRRDKDGNYRELHTSEAAECIDYNVLPDYRIHYSIQKDIPTQVVECPFFTTAVYDLTEPMLLDYSELDSFVILIGVGGKGTITADGDTKSLCCGETVLLPATTGIVKVEGTVRFLETYT